MAKTRQSINKVEYMGGGLFHSASTQWPPCVEPVVHIRGCEPVTAIQLNRLIFSPHPHWEKPGAACHVYYTYGQVFLYLQHGKFCEIQR